MPDAKFLMNMAHASIIGGIIFYAVAFFMRRFT